MFEREIEQEQTTLAAERGRSPSDAASVVGGGVGPTPAAVDRPQVASPTGQAGPPDVASQAPAQPSDEVLVLPEDGSLGDAPFTKEPFEEVRRPRLVGTGAGHGRRLVRPEESPQPAMTPEQRLLVLDTWRRSGLPAGDFAALCGLSKHTLYAWKKKFDQQGPAGLLDRPRGGPSPLRTGDGFG